MTPRSLTRLRRRFSARFIVIYGFAVLGLVAGGVACSGNRTEPELEDKAGLVAEWKYLGSFVAEAQSTISLDPEAPSAELTDNATPVRVTWIALPCKDVPKMTVTKTDDIITFDVARGPKSSATCEAMLATHFFEMRMAADAVGSKLMRKPLVIDPQ